MFKFCNSMENISVFVALYGKTKGWFKWVVGMGEMRLRQKVIAVCRGERSEAEKEPIILTGDTRQRLAFWVLGE